VLVWASDVGADVAGGFIDSTNPSSSSRISGSPDALVTPLGASDFREMAMFEPYRA